MFMIQFTYAEAKISPQLETRMLCLGKEDWYAKVMPNFPKIMYA